jgi:deoxyribose-phosphate aldolase
MNLEQVAAMIDLSCVQSNSTFDDIDESIALAEKYGVICLFALPAHTPYLIEQSRNLTKTFVGGPVAFPGGATTSKIKALEAKEMVEMGCKEIDMVNNIAWLKAGKYDKYSDDIKTVIDACGVPVKVILESAHLNEFEIQKASELCAQAGVDYVKTGTGWAEGGTTMKVISLIKDAVDGACKIKAAGGIKDLKTLMEIYNAGATRFGIGVRSAKSIFAELDK